MLIMTVMIIGITTMTKIEMVIIIVILHTITLVSTMQRTIHFKNKNINYRNEVLN